VDVHQDAALRIAFGRDEAFVLKDALHEIARTCIAARRQPAVAETGGEGVGRSEKSNESNLAKELIESRNVLLEMEILDRQ
jgi:hypothetical protein